MCVAMLTMWKEATRTAGENSVSHMLVVENLQRGMIEEMGEGDEQQGRARELRGLSRKGLWSNLRWVEDRRRLRGGGPHTPCPK